MSCLSTSTAQKKIESFQPSLLNTSTCQPHHLRFIVADLRALGNKLCKPWQINRLQVQKNGLIGSVRTCVTNVTHFALLQDFDLSRQHPSGRWACLIFALQKIGMAFKGFTISTAENYLSQFSTVVALQKCFIRFCTCTLCCNRFKRKYRAYMYMTHSSVWVLFYFILALLGLLCSNSLGSLYFLHLHNLRCVSSFDDDQYLWYELHPFKII